MASTSKWRLSLGAADRYENIEKLMKRVKARGASFIGNTYRRASEAEAQAYDVSESREAYEAACNAVSQPSSVTSTEDTLEPTTPGITIGEYQNCHRVSTGFCSEVYRCKRVALKVIMRSHSIEPHNPQLEIKILLAISHPSIVKLNTNFRDSQNRLVLAFPYYPSTLANLLSAGAIANPLIASLFRNIFSALSYLHAQDIIHRDIKPSNILLETMNGPALLSDFGTAWHPVLSLPSEPPTQKQIEVGTTTYRAPETLFGWHAYGTSLDLWASGVMLAECLRNPPKPLFESRETSENGNQLGLILSMFQTIGTPTTKSWPEACAFSTPPFEWYKEFPAKKWEFILQGVEEQGVDLVSRLVLWESSSRLTADEALKHPLLRIAD